MFPGSKKKKPRPISVKKTSGAPKYCQPHHPAKMEKVDAPIEMQKVELWP
jgi:hypothetical protein